MTRTRIIAVCLCWLLAWTALPSWGRDTLHEATVPVADRTTAARDAAVKQALTEVLIRLSGDAAAPTQAAGRAILAEPNRYLQQYLYEGSETGAEGGGASDSLYFRAGFDAAALEAALQKRGVTLWGRERPSPLVWLAVDDGKRRYLLGAEDNDAVLTELQAAARRQGLTLILPLLDLEDQSKVTFSDVHDIALERLLPASGRYQPQAVLVGSLKLDGTSWVSDWGMHNAGADARWRANGASLPAMLDAGLGQVDTRLVASTPKPTAAVPQGLARLPVRVEGVLSLADYARVSAYLAGLPTVRSTELEAVMGQTLDFIVDVQGGAAGLNQVVALGGVLEPVAPASGVGPSGAGPGGAAVYRLRP
ncbi:MAG: DUF2066 domain-containing protein [Gammaproteobacteria bacterium]|nr:DUF2066 domain-containing protein [Gammaproteobacteria bacterium]